MRRPVGLTELAAGVSVVALVAASQSWNPRFTRGADTRDRLPPPHVEAVERVQSPSRLPAGGSTVQARPRVVPDLKSSPRDAERESGAVQDRAAEPQRDDLLTQSHPDAGQAVPSAPLEQPPDRVSPGPSVPRGGPHPGYRLRFDTRWQAVAYRGVTLDSIPVSDTVQRPGSGPESPDGFAVLCRPGAPYCSFFRPGPTRRGSPFTTTADLTVWGLGLSGLSVHATGWLGLDFTGSDVWPGTDPPLQLLEGYAEYAVTRATARLGRQIVASRLGTTGIDGAGVVLRDARRGLEIQGYLGSGLARGVALPVTSPALNPLDDFQPVHRQIVAGAGAGWRSGPADARVDYLREVDPGPDYFVSERVGLGATLRPFAGFQLAGGADYDIAAGWWGSAEASLAYARRTVQTMVGVRRYRPHFDLWTIWGAFSPVPYRAVQASLAVAPISRLELRGRWERYEFDEAEAATPLFDAQRDGWRWEVGGTYRFHASWTLDGGYRQEFGPGAGIAAVGGMLTYVPSRRLTMTLLGSTATRPLEFRFNEAEVRTFGIDAELEPSERLRLGVSADRYQESHHRPDAAAFDWSQLRLSARVVVLFGSPADLRGLPPSIRVLPGDRSAR